MTQEAQANEAIKHAQAARSLSDNVEVPPVPENLLIPSLNKATKALADALNNGANLEERIIVCEVLRLLIQQADDLFMKEFDRMLTLTKLTGKKKRTMLLRPKRFAAGLAKDFVK